jgi:spermidine synthase
MSVFSATAAVVLVPGILIGSVFPYLMKHSEEWVQHAGKTIGELASVNTVAAIVGSLAAGFFLLDWFGLWNSVRLVAAAYLLLSVSIVFPFLREVRGLLAASLPAIGLALLATVVDYGHLPVVSLDPNQGEQLIWLREGSHGTVAVIRRGDDLRLKVNNHYLLGTAASTPNQRIQSWLPLSLHPSPQRVFFLGMGTGITAGGALHYPVEEVVVTELNPDVVEAARTHFRPHLNGLFDDRRARVTIDDGRTYLAATDESFDVIIADIFLTYRAGVGSLYTREHFQAVRSRLAPDGLFAQWLPMFELSNEEFAIIAGTLLEVFPQVTLWRRGFSPRFPVFALVASTEPRPLNPAELRSNLRRLVEEGIASPDLWLENIPLAAFAGNVSLDANELRNVPISTDDRRPLEYLSPITERNARGARSENTLAWLALADFCERWIGEPRLRRDPYLSSVGDSGRYEIEAGLALYRWATFRRVGEAKAAEESRRRYEALVEKALQSAS